MKNLSLLFARAILGLSLIFTIVISTIGGCVRYVEPKFMGGGTTIGDGQVKYQIRIVTKRTENKPAVDESTPSCEFLIYSPYCYEGRITIEPMDVCKYIPKDAGGSFTVHYCYYQGDIILENVPMECDVYIWVTHRGEERVTIPNMSNVNLCRLVVPFGLKFIYVIGDIESDKCEDYINYGVETYFVDYSEGEHFLDEIPFDDYLEECEE